MPTASYAQSAKRAPYPDQVPSCLNCCAFMETLEERCDEETESDYIKSFIRHRTIFLATSTILFGGMMGFSHGINSCSRSQAITWTLRSLATWGTAVFFKQWWTFLTQFTGTVWWSLDHSQHSSEMVKGTLLFLRSSSDWNGALSSPYIASLFHDYIVLFKDMEDLGDIRAVIHNTKALYPEYPLRALILMGHGHSKGMEMGESGIETDNFHRLKTAFDLLEPDATLILDSCSVASGRYSIAEKIAEVADGKKVYAASDYIALSSTMDTNLKPYYDTPFTMLLPVPFLDAGVYLGITKCYQFKNDLIQSCSE